MEGDVDTRMWDVEQRADERNIEEGGRMKGTSRKGDVDCGRRRHRGRRTWKKGMTKKTYVKEGDIEGGSRVNGTSRKGEDEGDVEEEGGGKRGC